MAEEPTWLKTLETAEGLTDGLLMDIFFNNTLREEGCLSTVLIKAQSERLECQSDLPRISPDEDNDVLPCTHFVFGVEEKLMGRPGFLHGGVIASLLDEVTGYCTPDGKYSYVTAQLDIKFIQRIPVPSLVYARGWVKKMEGRKKWAVGVLGDGNGKMYARAEALFIDLMPKL
ncbi:hypothetical protein PROFUN_05383 [Planoprotostelium fungivorum]|uniref:Acyl-coenzyme A thioesterase THEM4 n=1 Tax=Planoprotostelium fungivorum TaxID=1890364 RepID=A0A2P6NQL2_9EUKA|nr:hypothetical protein PROFUN_05383 [Planoprotostelium fungivorum]